MSAILEGVTLNGSSIISSSSSLPKKKGAATPAAPKPNNALLPKDKSPKPLAPPLSKPSNVIIQVFCLPYFKLNYNYDDIKNATT